MNSFWGEGNRKRQRVQNHELIQNRSWDDNRRATRFHWSILLISKMRSEKFLKVRIHWGKRNKEEYCCVSLDQNLILPSDMVNMGKYPLCLEKNSLKLRKWLLTVLVSLFTAAAKRSDQNNCTGGTVYLRAHRFRGLSPYEAGSIPQGWGWGRTSQRKSMQRETAHMMITTQRETPVSRYKIHTP